MSDQDCSHSFTDHRVSKLPLGTWIDVRVDDDAGDILEGGAGCRILEQECH